MVDTVRTQAELLALLHPNILNGMPDATVLQSQTARDLIVSLPGGQLISPINMTQSFSNDPAAVSANTITVNHAPGVGSGGIRGLSLLLNVIPSAAGGGPENSAIMTFTSHTSGVFDITVMRGVGATISQTVAATTIGEMRSLQGHVSVTGGTGTLGWGCDSSWAVGAGATLTNFIHYNSRQVGGGGAPANEYGAILYGLSQMEKGLVIGSFTSVTNTSLNILQQTLVPSGAAAFGINMANVITATANSQAFYGMNVAQTIVKGAFTGLAYWGLALLPPAASGAGTFASAHQLFLGLPTIATANTYIYFDTADATALGAIAGRLAITVAGSPFYLPYYSP